MRGCSPTSVCAFVLSIMWARAYTLADKIENIEFDNQQIDSRVVWVLISQDNGSLECPKKITLSLSKQSNFYRRLGNGSHAKS